MGRDDDWGEDRDRGPESDDRRRRLSWSEIDRLRSQPASTRSGHPRGRAARERDRRETHAALRDAEALFGGDKGGEEGAALAAAVREAHGSPGLATACRAYLDALGAPDTPELLSMFLDTGEKELMVPALERLLALKERGRVDVKGALKLQLRTLAEHADDEVAGLSEDLLA